MFWAFLVAGGVAIVCMTLFAAHITKRTAHDPTSEDEFVPDPDDPWAAWKPRPITELDRPRPRVWPLAGTLTGLVLLGAGLAGARQTMWATTAAPTTGLGPVAQVTSHPDIVHVEVTEAPTPPPTPVPTVAPVAPTPAPTVAPQPASTASTQATSGAGPSISGYPSCSSGKLSISYTLTANGSRLSWFGVYADGKAVKGGPISGTTYSGSYSSPATSGDHALEITAQDASGKTTRKQYQVHCA